MFEDNVDFIGFLPPEVDVEPLTKRPKMGAEESQNVADIVDAGQANNENDDRDALPKMPAVVAKSSRPTKSITIDMMMEAATPWLSSYLYAASTNAGKGKNATDLPGDSSVLEMHDFLALPPIRQLHEEILAFSSYISPTSQERLARLACVNRIEAALKKAWPSAKVSPFGSFYTELYLPSSDIDLVCIIEGMGESVPESVLKKAARALLNHQLAVPDSLKIISKARIPLVKLTEAHTNFTVDISFNQASGVDGSDNIRALLVKYPAIRPLLLVLKQFLVCRGLNEVFSGGLGSYAVTLMLTSFLQLHPLLQTKWISATDNLGVLLIEFFELYGKNLNVEQVGISILGQKNGNSAYFDKDERRWTHPRKSYLLSLEDPYNPENDVTKGSFQIVNLRQAFQHAYEMLSAIITMKNQSKIKNNPNPNTNNTSNNNVATTSIEEVKSYLSAILTFDMKTLHHRQFIEELGPNTIS